MQFDDFSRMRLKLSSLVAPLTWGVVSGWGHRGDKAVFDVLGSLERALHMVSDQERNKGMQCEMALCVCQDKGIVIWNIGMGNDCCSWVRALNTAQDVTHSPCVIEICSAAVGRL